MLGCRIHIARVLLALILLFQGGADFGRIVVRLKHQPGIKTGSCEPGDTDVEVSFPYFIK
jgi:hypothetical protein